MTNEERLDLIDRCLMLIRRSADHPRPGEHPYSRSYCIENLRIITWFSEESMSFISMPKRTLELLVDETVVVFPTLIFKIPVNDPVDQDLADNRYWPPTDRAPYALDLIKRHMVLEELARVSDAHIEPDDVVQ